MNFATKYIRVFLLWMLSTSLYFPAHAQSKSSKPNIIFILADDLGWMDITLNGSKYYNTPNIDRLAKRGMTFSNAYTANPLCSPTRVSILSGQYPARIHLTTPGGHLAPNPDVPLMKSTADAWQKMITPDSRTFMPLETYTIAEALKTAGYESVGRVMDKLDDLNLTDNTLIIFYSDNGGNMYDIVDGKDATNNYPLRGGKGNIYEGGVKVPLIVSWPAKVKAGSKNDEIVSSVDMYSTLLDVASLKPQKKQVLDGLSLVPVLTAGKKLNRSIYCHFPHYIPATNTYPATSVRKGDWKLIHVYGEGPERKDSFELYNLKEDEGENRSLTGQMPGKVKELDKLIVNHVKEVDGIFPVLNPAYSPVAKNTMGIRSHFPLDKYLMY